MSASEDAQLWFYRLPYQMPWYKRLIWTLFGERKVGTDGEYKVVAYVFRGITLISSIEVLTDHTTF